MSHLCQLFNLLFGFQIATNIANSLKSSDDVAFRVGDERGVDQHRNFSALTIPGRPPDPGYWLSALHGLCQQAFVCPALGRAEHHGTGHASDDLLTGITGKLLHMLVHVGNHQIGIHGEKGSRKIVENTRQGGKPASDFGLSQKNCLDITEDDKAAGRIAAFVVDGGSGHRPR